VDGGEELADCFRVILACGVPIYDECEIDPMASEEYTAGDRANVKIIRVGTAALGIGADAL